MLEQTATGLQYASDAPGLHSRRDPNRELTRYVFCLGDHIEPKDKRQMDSIGGWAGGIWIGHSENEGCPTMFRTNHMILRGAAIPLETRAIGKKADHKSLSPGDEEYLAGTNTRGYTVYAGDDANYLSADRFKQQGIVELSPLYGKGWATHEALTLQLHFFPEFPQWAKREGEFPTLLREWEDLVKDGIRRAQTNDHAIAGEEMLESARLFRSFGLAHIERNRQAILSVRSTNMGGFTTAWSEKSRLYAKQLEVQLEAEESAKPSDNSELIAEMRADRQLREREIALREAELAAKTGVSVPVIPIAEAPVELPPLDVDSGQTFSVGDKVLVTIDGVEPAEGKITHKPGGRLTVEFPDGSKSTVMKSQATLING